MWIGQLYQYSAYIVESVKGAILRIRGSLTLSIDEVHSCDVTIGLGKDTQPAVSTQDNLGVCFKPPVQYVMQILVNKLATWYHCGCEESRMWHDCVPAVGDC